MDEYKGMTDKELIARLKKYSIPHGPVVGSTRKLYEKKIYEYETERTQYPSPGGSVSHTEPATSQSYVKETFVSPRKREDFSYGREALGSTRTYFKEYVPTRQEYYSEYRDEDPSPTKSNLSYNYSLPHYEEHSSYTSEDRDVNTSEPSRSSYRSYSSLLSHTTSPGTVSARQPIAEPYPYSSSEKDTSAEKYRCSPAVPYIQNARPRWRRRLWGAVEKPSDTSPSGSSSWCLGCWLPSWPSSTSYREGLMITPLSSTLVSKVLAFITKMAPQEPRPVLADLVPFRLVGAVISRNHSPLADML
ncbi:emerin isoform X2 [Pantherophis guttatus]|uniref:Emerin isoform X2 n=1 Tax=Pantherophis guttatus TaxID=94885 RepID=A0A6P9DD76_PANGU|nr:emerin isoform X2 [Pantherophis guttatus]